jgi:5-methylcytosine-specific restriction endonuclease McrA
MPIKPENKKLYSKHWKAIRANILARAHYCCEFCSVPNLSHISTPEELRYWSRKKPVTIVLTIAHLDHDPTNNDPENLKALCQKCHLTYDAKHHAENAKKTRMAKKAVGDLPGLS